MRYKIPQNKKQWWEEYRSEVAAFELRKNLPVLWPRGRAGFPPRR
ncbi:hypothetical protein [Streptomyces brasiliensis]|nr:hypothetical protein [Streptomyces brasiliensis]